MASRREHDEDALVIMVKYPEPGKVKTRLAPGIGLALAAELYCAFILDLAHRFGRRGQPWALHWAVAPADARFADIVGEGACLQQRGADLGARLHNVFGDLRALGFERIVVISSDSPHIPEGWLRDGFVALAESDVVLGPAADGGYYAIGMRRPHDLFSGVTWSTAAVLGETIGKAQAQGLAVRLLPTTFDVDEPADLAALESLLRGTEDGAVLTHTRAALARLRFPEALPYPLAASAVGSYWLLTEADVEAEAAAYRRVTDHLLPRDTRALRHMHLVTRVATALVERLNADLGLSVSAISACAAERHDVCRAPRRVNRLRPYGPDMRGVPPVRHDGHEARLAWALWRSGAPAIARIVRRHNVIHALYPSLRTVDDNVLLIADAMVEGDAIVPIAVRREAVTARYADAHPGLVRAFRRAYDLVEKTIALYCQAGLSRARLYEALGVRD